MMAENKMQAVARLFDKELDERFILKSVYKDNFICKFSERGLLYFDTVSIDWMKAADYLLTDLLTGKAVILNEEVQ